MTVIWWTDEERKLLRNLYPDTEKKEIIRALKNKSWYACQKEAKRLGLQRQSSHAGRPKKKPKQYIGKRQLAELIETDLTIDEIAKKLRTEPDIVRRYIFKYNL